MGNLFARKSADSKGLLFDVCPSYRKEINVLTMAVQEGLVAELKKGGLSEVSVHALASRLYNAMGIDKALAEWSLRAWAEALGLETVGGERGLVDTSGNDALQAFKEMLVPFARGGGMTFYGHLYAWDLQQEDRTLYREWKLSELKREVPESENSGIVAAMLGETAIAEQIIQKLENNSANPDISDFYTGAIAAQLPR